jgi:hypothetical protein
LASPGTIAPPPARPPAHTRPAAPFRVWCWLRQVRRLMGRRMDAGWSFSTLFLVKDSLAIMLEAAGLLEDALREYYELDACYLEALEEGGALAGEDFGERLRGR